MDTTKKLVEILAGFESAMLVTQRPDDQLTARPMAVAQVTDDGGIWFMTEGDSGKHPCESLASLGRDRVRLSIDKHENNLHQKLHHR